MRKEVGHGHGSEEAGDKVAEVAGPSALQWLLWRLDDNGFIVM